MVSKIENVDPKVPKQAEAKRDGVINPQNYNFNRFNTKNFDRCSQNATNQQKSTIYMYSDALHGSDIARTCVSMLLKFTSLTNQPVYREFWMERTWRLLYTERGRLLSWTPGPVPLWLAYDLIAETRRSWINMSCLSGFDFWHPSVFLFYFTDIWRDIEEAELHRRHTLSTQIIVTMYMANFGGSPHDRNSSAKTNILVVYTGGGG